MTVRLFFTFAGSKYLDSIFVALLAANKFQVFLSPDRTFAFAADVSAAVVCATVAAS